MSSSRPRSGLLTRHGHLRLFTVSVGHSDEAGGAAVDRDEHDLPASLPQPLRTVSKCGEVAGSLT